MPRAPAFKIPALADLQRQLQYAPPETRKRQIDAAERLVGEIDPNLAYPREFVIFRITGYRPEGDDLTTFAGAALRADLATFVQRISDTLDLVPQRNGHAALSMHEVARQLGVSSKTIQRYRGEGLVCHVVAFSERERHLACYADALSRFREARKENLQSAARFSRMGDETEAAILQQAAHLRASKRLSLNAAAKIIARRHGRAHETIRQMLRKHDQASARNGERPIFEGDRGPLSEREVVILHRAWMRGVDLGLMAERFDRSRPAIHRAIARRRAGLLRELKITSIAFPTFERIGADDVILSSSAATTDLHALPPHDEALGLLSWAGQVEPAGDVVEDALLGAWNLLKRRAATGISAITIDGPHGSDRLDAIETDLRWATRLHRRLTLLAFPAALRRIEANHGRSLVSMPAEQIVALIHLSAGVIRESLESVNPSRGQRLERVVSFGMERALAQRDRSASAAKASARHPSGTVIPLHGIFDAIDEWEPWLDPWRNQRSHLAALPETSRELIAMRYGWNGSPPRTIRGLAAHFRRGGPLIARRLQKAIRELRAAMRGRS